MFSKAVASILTVLASKFLAWALEFVDRYQQQNRTDKDIDKKLEEFKDAYKQALKSEPADKLQRQALSKSIIDFIHNNNRGGL